MHVWSAHFKLDNYLSNFVSQSSCEKKEHVTSVRTVHVFTEVTIGPNHVKSIKKFNFVLSKLDIVTENDRVCSLAKVLDIKESEVKARMVRILAEWRIVKLIELLNAYEKATSWGPLIWRTFNCFGFRKMLIVHLATASNLYFKLKFVNDLSYNASFFWNAEGNICVHEKGNILVQVQ